MKTTTLTVNVCCKGCKRKMARGLHKIRGVEDVKFDAEENKVIVTGETDSATLIKKLAKLNKQAVLLDESVSDDKSEEKAPEEKAPEENKSSSPSEHGGETQPPTETMTMEQGGYWPQAQGYGPQYNMDESTEICSVM